MRKSPVLCSFALCIATSLFAQVGPLRLVEQRRWGGTSDDTTLSFVPTSGSIHASGAFAVVLPQLSRVLRGQLNVPGLAPIGRSGQGPGEYLRPTSNGWLADSLWIWDSALLRLSWVSLTGRFLGSEPSRQWGNIIPLRDGRWYRFEPSGVDDTSARIALVRRDHVTVSQIVSYSWHSAPPLQIPTQQGTIVGRQPFSNGAFVGVDPASDDLLILEPRNEPGALRFRRIGPSGAVLVSRVLRVPTQLLTDFHYQRMLRWWLEAGAAPHRSVDSARLRRALFRPPYLPTVRGMVVARDGSIWIQAGSETERETTWVVLTKGGTIQGAVTGPPGLTLLTIAGHQALGVDTDRDGLSSLIQFRVPDL